MKELKFFMNEFIFMANSILLLCYLQTNLLMFRLLFIAACIFFTINALSLPVISIDAVIFNIFFTIINIYLATPLIKNLAPPNFTKEQKEIFENHFRNYLTPMELSKLLFYHRRRIYRVTTPIVKAGNEFSSLFFITKIGKNCTVRLKSKKNKLDLSEFSWLGVPEYLDLISKKECLALALKDSSTCEWNISITAEVNNPHEIFNPESDEDEEIKIDTNLLINDYNEEDNNVILYEFELNSIDKIFSDSVYGVKIMRGLYSIWLKYCADIVKKVDQAITAVNTTAASNMKRFNSSSNPDESKMMNSFYPTNKQSTKRIEFNANK